MNDLKGTFVDGNRVAEELVGYKREELIGSSFLKLNLLSVYDIPRAAKLLAMNVLGKPTGPDEFILTRKDGSQVLVEISTYPVKIEGRSLVLGIARDITERRRGEEALRASARFKHIFENQPEYCYMVSPNGMILDVNRVVLKVLGYGKEEIIGKPLRMIYAPESLPKMKRLLEAWNEFGRLRNGEMVIITKKGDRRTVLLSTDALKDEDGDILTSISVQRDITERKRMEAALRESEERYRSVYETAPLALVIWDLECRVMGWNDRAEEIFGWSREEVLGRNFFEFLIPESVRPRVEDALLRGEMEPEVVNENLTKSGKIIICEWNNSTLRDNEGQAVGAMSLGLDITERARAEEERRRLEAQVQHVRSWRAWACSPAASRTTSTICWWPFWAMPIWRYWNSRRPRRRGSLSRTLGLPLDGRQN